MTPIVFHLNYVFVMSRTVGLGNDMSQRRYADDENEKTSQSSPAFSMEVELIASPANLSDSALPKLVRRLIRPHHSHLPAPRELPPHAVSSFPTNSASAICAKDKKLGHIPDCIVPGSLRNPAHQNESSKLSTDLDEKRVAPRFAPVESETGIPKPAVRTRLNAMKFAEVMGVQLKQVCNDRHLFDRGFG